MHEYTRGREDVYVHENTPVWHLAGWLDKEHFMSFDHFNDRQVACVALGQIYTILDWMLRFAPDHSQSIDLFMVNLYHKIWFWISPWWAPEQGEVNFFNKHRDLNMDQRDDLFAKMSKTEQYKYISTIDLIKKLGFGFNSFDGGVGPLEQKVSKSVFEEARKKFKKAKPAHIDDALLNELTEMLEGINDGAGIGVGCVATFISGKPKQESLANG